MKIKYGQHILGDELFGSINGFLDSLWISGFVMDFGVWIHDGFWDSRWVAGFTMDFWIHDGFRMGFENIAWGPG